MPLCQTCCWQVALAATALYPSLLSAVWSKPLCHMWVLADAYEKDATGRNRCQSDAWIVHALIPWLAGTCMSERRAPQHHVTPAPPDVLPAAASASCLTTLSGTTVLDPPTCSTATRTAVGGLLLCLLCWRCAVTTAAPPIKTRTHRPIQVDCGVPPESPPPSSEQVAASRRGAPNQMGERNAG
jgi:hypothetical protein